MALCLLHLHLPSRSPGTQQKGTLQPQHENSPGTRQAFRRCFLVGWMADRWMDRPAPKSQARWQMEKLAHGWHCLEEEIQEEPTWQYRLFTSAASTEGLGEKAGPGIQNPSLDPSPCHRRMAVNQSPGLSEPHSAPLPRKGSHLSRPPHKSLWARVGPVSG